MKPGRNVRRFHDGSVLVARLIGRAFVPEGRPVAAVIRCGATCWISPSLLDLAHQSPVWMVGATCAWCVAAWRAEEQPEGENEMAEPTHTDAEIYEDTVTRLRALIGDRNGVLLTAVLADWQGEGWIAPEVTGAELGRQFQRRGIPVRASLKVAGQVGPGVHRDDLPAAAEPLPYAPSVAVG